jgi:hypothetical protein
MNDALTPLKTKGNRLWLSVGLAALFLLTAGSGAFFVTSLSPLWTQETLRPSPELSSEYKKLTKTFPATLKEGPLRPDLSVILVGTRPQTPLIFEEFMVEGSVRRNAKGQLAWNFRPVGFPHKRVRFDRLIAGLPCLLILAYAIYSLLKKIIRQEPGKSAPSGVGEGFGAELLLAREIERLEGAFTHYDSRAGRLLWFTGAAAIGGLGIFYYFVPTETLVSIQQGGGTSIPSTVIKLFLLATYMQGVAILLARLHRQTVGDSEGVMRQRLSLLRLLVASQLAKAKGASVTRSEEKIISKLLTGENDVQPEDSPGSDNGTGKSDDESSIAGTVGKILSEIRKHLPGGKSST